MNDAQREVLVVHYGTLMTTRAHAFLNYRSRGKPDGPLRMDYYFWVVREGDDVLLIDTGFDPDVGRRRGRTCFVAPLDALTALEIHPEQVHDIVITHFHYDHIGNLSAFPQASLWIQRREDEYWRRQEKSGDQVALEYVEPAELSEVFSAVDSGRAKLVDGDATPHPRVSLHLVGGHTPGQQIVRVETDERPVVIASDACHFEEEVELDHPHALVTSVPEMLAGYETLRALDAGGALVLAGHDPGIPHRLRPVARLGDGTILTTKPA